MSTTYTLMESAHMLAQLNDIYKRHQALTTQLQDPTVTSKPTEYQKLVKEFAELEKIVLPYKQYKKVLTDLEANQKLVQDEKDPELQQMAKDELTELEQQKTQLTKQLQLLLLPKDPNDEKNVIIEVRAGAGGDEASLFAQELFRAYCLFAEKQKWQVQMVSQSEGNVGGVKEVIANIIGQQVYSRLKFESGVHRVQRVPKTESQGRVHTSTVTVAVLPEADAVDVKVEQKDIRIDVYRSSGPGGQSVNTTDSAVRVTHIPTGLIVTCQDGKSQHSNKQQALKVLYSRLLDLEREKQQKQATQDRLSQIGTGDRSQRIRTYNFPQTRITDHRIGLTTHTLNQVMQGDMTELVDAVRTYYQLESLKHSASSV